MAIQTLTLAGKRFVILPEKEYRALRDNKLARQPSGRARRPHRMTAQDRGDVAEAKRRLADPADKIIPFKS